MSINLSLDKKMADLWYPLAPHFNVLGMDEPFKPTNNIKLAKPIIATAGIWLEEEEDDDTEEVERTGTVALA